MPQKIKPIIDTTVGGKSYNLDPGGEWSWLARQEYSPSQSYAAIGQKTRGGLQGGPTFEQFLSQDDPKKFTVLGHPPPLTTAILQGDVNGNGGRKVGQLSLDLIDPFGTMAEFSGSYIGQDQPALGNGGSAFDPGRFLGEKGIDLFGHGDVGVPARLADYALALPIAVLNKMRGVTSAEPSANSGMTYRFQADPGYWRLLEAANTDDEIRAIARTVAGKYIDPSRNQALVEQLVNQFKSDRDTVLTAISSGNDRIDYIAKWHFASEVAAAQAAPDTAAGNGFSERNWRSSAIGVSTVSAEFLSAIPFVGTQLAAGIAPVDVIDPMWKALTVEQRRKYFETAGIATGVLDFAVQLPLLSGLGSALSVAKASKGIAGTLYKGYETTLRATGLVMGSGLVVATTNWALEAAWPGYSDVLGTEIDRARPVSKSSLAGVVNELGFWSSGSFGVVPAVQIAARSSSKVAGALAAVAGKVPHPTVPTIRGQRELSFFRDGYGGSMERTELAGAGLTGVDTAVKASFLSHLLNWVERTHREPIEAAMRGEVTPWQRVNEMDPLAREQWANDELGRSISDGPEAAEALIRVMEYSRRPQPVLPSESARTAWAAARAAGRTLDEQLASDVIREYGPDFVASSRVVGRFDTGEMEAWARKKTTELGGDGAKLGKHDVDGWTKVIRTLHQYEYHHLNGELAAAIEREASSEAGKLAMIASDHVFRDNAETLLETLPTLDPAAARALIADTIKTRREAAAWFTNEYRPKAGHAKVPENVSPDAFAAWLEDAMPALPTRRINAAEGASTALDPINALQAKIDAQGTWTLAFKPVDGEGNFVSYARTRSGGILRSPWVEYPLTGADNIELGNRGYLASKMDSLSRGFRTRRLTEFQRASMYRQITELVNVLPEQIDAFHDGILKLAHDSRVPPQAVGTIAKLQEVAFGGATLKEINNLAEKVFGPGDLIGRDGKRVRIDWAHVVSKAYRQSFKLNLTAGLTSQLKSMGPIGAAASVAADIMYVAWRFGFSPLFKGGEFLESDVFNGLRGVFRRDPTTEALYVHGGLGNDGSLLSSELNFDSMVQAITGRGDWTPSQRLAASLTMHARHLPEDLRMTRERASTQAAADEVLAHHREFDDAIAMLQRDGEAIDPDTGDLLRATDDAAMGDLVLDLERRGAAAAEAQPDLPPLSDNPDELLHQLNATLNDAPRDRPTPTEEGGLLSELDSIVGEQGVYPGLEARAKEILDRLDEILRAQGDEGPVMLFADQSPARQAQLRQAMFDSGDLAAAAPIEGSRWTNRDSGAAFVLERITTGRHGEVAVLRGPAGETVTKRLGELDSSEAWVREGATPDVEAAYARWQRRPGNTDDVADVAGTPEALFENILPAFAEAEIKKGAKGWFKEALNSFWHPTNYKQGRALALQIKMMRDTFPGLLRSSGNDGVIEVFKRLGIPEERWTDWLLEDRKLLNGWLDSANDPAAMAKLLDHAGNDVDRAAWDELYASEEWRTVSSLWAINLQATRDEAFGVHFFSPYRSAIERTINHPVLGIYPASWTIKAAREWAKFLFDNRTFGDLHLGMAPAQAVAQLARDQASEYAQEHDETLQHFMQKGPLGSTIFIFNLMMPGDWSSLPFPLSRTIREILRGNTDAGNILAKNLDFLGATRDLQLISESLGEMHDLVLGKQHVEPKRLLTGVSAKAIDDQFGAPR